MYYNLSKQDELQHSSFLDIKQSDLIFFEPNFNIQHIEGSIFSGEKIDEEILKNISSEIFGNRIKIDPLKLIQQEKTNSDILLLNPKLNDLSTEESKKLLEFKENYFFSFEKYSNFNLKNNLELVSWFSEYLFNFSLTNLKSSINEFDSIKDLEKNLKNLKNKLQTSETIMGNYFKLIPILEEFAQIDINNIAIKFQYLEEIKYNLNAILGNNNEINIKINPILKTIFKKFESILHIFENKLKDDGYVQEEIKNEIKKLFKLIFNLSFSFKFSYGFFFLIKYIKKFGFEYDFPELINFSEFNRIPDNSFSDESKFNKTWNTSKVNFPYNVLHKFKENLKNFNDTYPYELFGLNKETSLAKVGKNIFLYNNTFGLLKMNYSEFDNSLKFLDINFKAFNLLNGNILSIGGNANDSGFILFLSNDFFNDEDNSYDTNSSTGNDYIKLILSDNINMKEDSLLIYKKKFVAFFENLKKWSIESFVNQDQNDQNNFVYTKKKIIIPKAHMNASSKGTNTKDMMKSIKFYINNNLLYSLRPISCVKSDKKISKIYLSNKFIYAIDIFDLLLFNEKLQNFDTCHIKSIILTTESLIKRGFNIESLENKYLENFLDTFNKINVGCSFIQSGRLIMMNNDLDFFVYDLIYDSIDIVNKYGLSEEEKKVTHGFNFYFMSKNDGLVILSEKNIGNIDKKFIWQSQFETIIKETSFSNYNSGLFDSIFFELCDKVNLNSRKIGTLETSNIANFINDEYNEEFYGSGEILDDIYPQKITEKNFDEKSENKTNFIIYLLGNLAYSANSKINEKILPFEKIFTENYLSYNEKENIQSLFDLVLEYFEEYFSKQTDSLIKNLICLLIIIKLHVRNNSKLKLDFSIYFKSREVFEEIIGKFFLHLEKSLELIQNNNNNLDYLVYLLIDNLFEILSSKYKEKLNMTITLKKFLINNHVTKLKFSELLSKNNPNDILFNINFKIHVIKSILGLFEKNSNYIISFILDDDLGKYIIDLFDDLLKIKENSIKNNKYSNDVYFDYIKDEKSSLNCVFTEINWINIKNCCCKILNIISTKILNTNTNFGKKIYDMDLDKILKNISSCGNYDHKEINFKIISFIISLSVRFLEASNMIMDLYSLHKIKLPIYDDFAFIGSNLILNYVNILNFETFPEMIFSNWYKVLNLLNKLSTNVNYINTNDEFTDQYKSLSDIFESKSKKDLFKFREKLHLNNKNFDKQNFCENIKNFDIVIDNFLIEDTKQKNEYEIIIDSEYLILDPNLKCPDLYDLFIELSSFCMENERKEKSIEIYETIGKTKNLIFSHVISKGTRINYMILKDISVKSSLTIKIYNVNSFFSKEENQTNNNPNNHKQILYKMRISNYKTFDPLYNSIIKTANLFINKSIKYLIYYENANLLNSLNVNEEVKELVSSSLFSGGMIDCKSFITKNKKLNTINKDLKSFFGSLDDFYMEKFEFLNEQNLETEFSELSVDLEDDKKKIFEQNCTISAKNYNISIFINDIKSDNVSFEQLISIKDYDYSDYECKNFMELNPKKKGFFLLNKLFNIFDYLIEKVHREYIVKGELIDKILLGIFFICFHQDDIHISLQKTLDMLFTNEENYQKFTQKNLDKEEVMKLMDNFDFEKVFFVWKNVCSIRKIFKSKKDSIFQQMDENYQDKKFNIEFEKTEIEFVKIRCNVDPKGREDDFIITYFERYLQKLKLIYYLKSNEIHKKKPELRKSYLLKKNKEKEISLVKKGSSYLKNLMRKNLLEENGDKMTNEENKCRKKIKDFIKNLLTAISSDNINPDNLLACLQSLNVKIKFREISLLIINIILKNLKNSEIKADLLSNFYNNFKQSNNLPNILDNLNISATEQSEIITNLFHEYLFHLYEELNSLFYLSDKNIKDNENYYKNGSNSIYYMTILLNNFLWNIKGRNFQFLLDIQFFQNMFNNNKNEYLKLGKVGMFNDPRQILYNNTDSTTASIICTYDIFHISNLLTDILKHYSNLVIKRIIKENAGSNESNEIDKNRNFGLVKSFSILDQVNHNELMIYILDNYQILLDELIDNLLLENVNEIEKKYENFGFKNVLNTLNNDEIKYLYIQEKNFVFISNLAYYQKKIWNLLMSILKLITIQDPSIDFVFNHLSLFTRIIVLSLFTNEKNTVVIFKIFRILMKNLNKNADDIDFLCYKLKDFYKRIFINYINSKVKIKHPEDFLCQLSPDEIESMDNMEFFIKFVLCLGIYISKIKNNKELLVFDKQIFLATNSIQNHIENAIEEKIFEFLRNFISLNQFKERSLKILIDIISKEKFGGLLISKVLDSNVGYLHNFCRVVCNTKLGFSTAPINKIFENSDVEMMVKKGIIVYDKSIFFLDEKVAEQKLLKYDKIQENKTEDNLVIAFIEENSNVLNQIEINSPNLLFPSLTEIMIDDEDCNFEYVLSLSKEYIEKILNFFEESLIQKNICALSYLQSYIRIVKFIKKISIAFDNREIDPEKADEYFDIKETIENFFNKHEHFFELFLVYDNEKTPSNLLNIDKLENLFFGYKSFDLKMLAQNKKENNLIFKNPIKNTTSVKMFPFGIDSISLLSSDQDTEIENNLKSQKIVKNINNKNFKLKIKHDENLVYITDNNVKVFRTNYTNLVEVMNKDCSDKHDKYLDSKGKAIRIFDKKMAIEILEDYKNMEEKKEIDEKKQNHVVFLTDEFLEYLNIKDFESDFNVYMDKRKDKFNDGNEKKSENGEEKKSNEENSQNDGSEEGSDDESVIDKNSIKEEKVLKDEYKNEKELTENNEENSKTNLDIEKIHDNSKKTTKILENKEVINNKIENIEIEKENLVDQEVKEIVKFQEVHYDNNEIKVDEDENQEKGKGKENDKKKEQQNQQDPNQEEKIIDEGDNKQDLNQVEKIIDEVDKKQDTNQEEKIIYEGDIKLEDKPKREIPNNQIILENFIKNNFDKSSLFIINEDYFNCLEKNFYCLSIDYDLLDNQLKEFLISPSKMIEKENSQISSININTDENDLSNYFCGLASHTCKDLTRDYEARSGTLKEIKEYLNKEKKNEDEEELVENNEEFNDNQIYENYLNFLQIKIPNNKQYPDSKLKCTTTFEKLLSNLEIISFSNQKESNVKSLGFHILKQHLRFLCLYYNKNYSKFENEEEFDENKIKNLLKYLKLLYFQTNFKERFFNIKNENQFIKYKILKIIEKFVKSKKNSINKLFNLNIKKIITFKDSILSENEAMNSDFLFFIDELVSNLNLSNLIFSKCNKSGLLQKNILMILRILSSILDQSVKNYDYSNIVDILEIFSTFLDNSILFINNNIDNSEDVIFRRFITQIIEYFINNQPFKVLVTTQMKKQNFSNVILEFVLKLVKFFELSIKVLDSKELKAKVQNFAKNYYKIYDLIDIIENKLHSKYLMKIVLENVSFFKNMITKKIKLPNLKNFYCLVLREFDFKKYDITFTNLVKNDNLYVTLGDLKFSITNKTLDYKSSHYASNSHVLNFNNAFSINNNIKSDCQKEIHKKVIFSEDINNIINKNLVLITSGKNPPIAFELNKKINSIYSVSEDNMLLYKLENKYFIKGYFDKDYSSTDNFRLIDEIAANETIYKFFESGVIVTDKAIHVIGRSTNVESSYQIHKNYMKFELGAISNPQKIILASFCTCGLLLVDSENKVFHSGFITYDPNDDDENTYKIEELKGFLTNHKIIDAQATLKCSVFLVQEDDGKCYIYASGRSKYGVHLMGRREYNIENIKIPKLSNIPFKKFILIKNSLFIGLTDDNQIYYSGTFVNLHFDNEEKCYQEISKWDWPEKNDFTLFDIQKPCGETVLIKGLNRKTGFEEMLVIGQIFMFNQGNPKFIKFADEPFKIDITKLYTSQDPQLKQNTTEEKKDEDDALLRDLEKELIKDIEELNLNQETDLTDNFLAISRYELNKIDETQDIYSNNFNDDENNGTSPAKHLKEYNIPLFSPLKETYKIKDVKMAVSKDINYRFAYILGYEFIEKTINFEYLKLKYIKDYCNENQEELDENSEEEEFNKDQEKSENDEDEITCEKENENDSDDKKKIKKGKKKKNKNKSDKNNDKKDNIDKEENKKEKIEEVEPENKIDKQEIEIEKIDEKSCYVIVHNKDDLLKDLLFDFEDEFIYIKIKIIENKDLFIISPMIFETRDELLFNSQEELSENKIMNEEKKLKKEKDKNSKVINPSNESKSYKIINNKLENYMIEIIKENFDELFNAMMICEDILIYKNILNPNYFEKDSKRYENIELTINPKDNNLSEIFPEIYSKVDKILKDNILKDINSLNIKEYMIAKYKYNKITNKNDLNFEEYLHKNYSDSELYSIFLKKSHTEIIEFLLNTYNESMIELINKVNLEFENNLSHLIMENINLIERGVKEKLIENEIRKLKTNSDRTNIVVDRISARRFRNTGLVDKKFEKTIFSQVYREMKKKGVSDYLKTCNECLFKVSLKGEGAIDAGGPGREIFTLIFEDLMSNRHDLFIQTPNQKTKSGLGRDLWTINPSANTSYHLDCFLFIGKVFGYSIVSKVYCPINLPRFVWKQILKLKPKPKDIEEIDVVAYNSIVKICLNPENYREELNSLFEFATFTACLSNGEEIELIENGKEIKVDESNYKQFIELYCNARYREIKEQAEAIAQGIKFVIPNSILVLLSADELNERIAGPKSFDLELLKRNTIYSGYKPIDKVILYFWKFMEECSLEEKIQYLKFVWGRTTLPNSDSNFDLKHQIEEIKISTDSLPISHTCYFSIDLPKYTSFEQLKTKLLYAMNNSYIISDNEDRIELQLD